MFHYVDPQSRVFAAIPGATAIGPVLDVKIGKILGPPGLEIAIPSPHNHEHTSRVVITRGTSRFVDEIHDHKGELRPSTEMLSALHKSEGRDSCVEESNNSNKETCAQHVTSRFGNKAACANNVSSLPNCSSLFRKTKIPTNEMKWVVILASSSYCSRRELKWLQNLDSPMQCAYIFTILHFDMFSAPEARSVSKHDHHLRIGSDGWKERLPTRMARWI